MAYYSYKCDKCSETWQGKKPKSKCPMCGSKNLKSKFNNDRYEVLDKAAETYAKKEVLKSNRK